MKTTMKIITSILFFSLIHCSETTTTKEQHNESGGSGGKPIILSTGGAGEVGGNIGPIASSSGIPMDAGNDCPTGELPIVVCFSDSDCPKEDDCFAYFCNIEEGICIGNPK